MNIPDEKKLRAKSRALGNQIQKDETWLRAAAMDGDRFRTDRHFAKLVRSCRDRLPAKRAKLAALLQQLVDVVSTKDWTVRWEIQVNADSPIEAARAALAAITRPGTQANVFDVVDRLDPAVVHHIDLEEQ